MLILNLILFAAGVTWSQSSVDYSKYTKCQKIDDNGNRIQYRYHCAQGRFFVQVSPCNYLDDKWIIRFAALDRLGGCTNVMEKRRSASISTSITTCKTVFEKKDGYVKIENNLHIFRNIEENIFDESVYPLSCSYKEISEFEYELRGVDGNGSLDSDLKLKFWTDSSYSEELQETRFRVGQGVFFSLGWKKNHPLDAHYAITKCFWNDKTEQKTYDIIRNGCVSELVNGDRHTKYAEHMDVDHKFSFNAFIFSQQSNNISMTCNVQICLPGEKDCNVGPASCPPGYRMGSGNSL